MKSIEDILTLVDKVITSLRPTIDIHIALIGGYAVISHGVGRTTRDVDFLIFSESIRENTVKFIDLLKNAFPVQFEMKWVEGSRMVGDPFPYDVIFLTDKTREYPKMDFIIPRYKWELEGLKKAKPLGNIPFPVLSLPYLISMKLRAGGPQDLADILQMYRFLSSKEKEETHQLAVRIKRDKNLKQLLEPINTNEEEPEDQDMLI